MSSECCEGSVVSEDCCPGKTGSEKHLVILGGGSAAFSAALKASELGGSATIINDGLPMGGTCVNVGCVPSKTLIRAAETLHRAASPQAFNGIETSGRLLDFKAVMDQKQQMVEDMRQAKYADVIGGLENVRYVQGCARLVDRKTVEVNGERIEADHILIATGASPKIPEIPGIESVPYLTNESAFELKDLPLSLIVLGGRYIALECAQMFARFGTEVTVLQRSERILPDQPKEIGDNLTGYLREEGLKVEPGVRVIGVYKKENQVAVETVIEGQPRTFQAEHLLIATGRQANTSNMGLEEVGVKTDSEGFILVNNRLETNVAGISSAGDVVGRNMFVYTAAYEGALAAENALDGKEIKSDYTALPWVIFTDPQVAGVGLDADQARQRGFDVDMAQLSLEHVPRSVAARDTRGFIQLIRDRSTDKLLGARILAPEGSELLMEISLAIKYGIPVGEMKKAFHPYLTLSEGVKLAALTFDKDVASLSCCAV